jgi:hypothetical protein
MGTRAAALLALLVLALPAALPRPARAAPVLFAYGVSLDSPDPRGLALARAAGFTHVRLVVSWPSLEPSPGAFAWEASPDNDLDHVLGPVGRAGLGLVLRVDGVPAWAGRAPARADLAAVRAFHERLARRAAGAVAAYEILNEPNLPREWGGPPSPAGYAAYLRAAYLGVKAGDPAAMVLGGGPSPNTGGLGGTIEDLDFLEGMYAAGARGAMDALAVHNYGGASPPERDPAECGICFRRAELYRAVMERHGDAGTPVWATEWGYVQDPGWPIGQHDWMKLPEGRRADYLVRAYRYAAERWPWMSGLLLWNLDASASPHRWGQDDGAPWFALLNPDLSPRTAWYAVRTLLAPLQLGPDGPPPAGMPGCGFRSGFLALLELIPAAIGDCTTDEGHHPLTGDGVQFTTRGLLVWQKADNVMRFTDGANTWTYGPAGLRTHPSDGRQP